MQIFRALLSTMLMVASCAALADERSEDAPSCDGSTETNRQLVLAFYEEGLIGLRPREAFRRFMSADFVEHKPDVAEGSREAAAAYLEQLIREVPEPRWEVLRTIAEGNFVFLHGRFSPAPRAESYAIADVFRLDHCRIVEHWDVVAPPPAEQLNPHPRF